MVGEANDTVSSHTIQAKGRSQNAKTDSSYRTPQRIFFKERNPRLTPTESCESDETEGGVKPFRAPPGLPDPLVDFSKK